MKTKELEFIVHGSNCEYFIIEGNPYTVSRMETSKITCEQYKLFHSCYCSREKAKDAKSELINQLTNKD